LAFFQIGPTELVVIGVIGILLFGKRLPEIGRSLGKSLVEFKKGMHDVKDEIDKAGEEDQPPTQG
jgi:sec-independent protein translocase protein TatA